MGYLLIFLVCLSQILKTATAQNGPSNWTIAPFNPPALPLAVRSPYLNVWLPQGNNPLAAYDVDNKIWDYNQAVQWYTSVAVDNREYRLLSPWAAGEATANQTAVEFTATRTSFLMSAAGVEFNMTFLDPIEPNNLIVQSLPFTYLYMTARSTDGQQHRVRMYSDIEGNIAAGDVHQIIKWSAQDSDDYVVLNTSLQNQQPFVENKVQAQDATVYYSFKKIKGFTTSWQISGFNAARGLIFSNPVNGRLNNSDDPRYRAPASGNDTPVFGISIDWGNITSTPEPAVWALGVYRNPSIRYRTSDGTVQARSPYFMSQISDPVDAPKFVLDDFPRALDAAEALDARIRSEAGVISSEYADLLALSARQAMGAMDITIPPPAQDGKWDTSDVKIFMKNIGSVGSDNGDATSVNNVDALYAAFPAFLYLNPDIVGYLLAPLLEYQDSDAYTLPYAATSIGSSYPSAIATGINDPHIYGVDETAGMIIMTLAYSLASGNGSLITKHYNLLRRWAEYLGNNTDIPSNQTSGDFSVNSGSTTSNHTNLGLKGIIGIAAMAKIAEATGATGDRNTFNAVAHDAIDRWQGRAVCSSTDNSNGLMYNLFADRLLKLNLIPDSVYTTCTSFYQSAAGNSKYGIPLDSSSSQNTSTNWMLFAASTASSNATRDLLISQVHGYATNNLNNAPFSSIYDTSTGLGGFGRASPAQGGIFSLLALGTTSKTINTAPSSSASSSRTRKPNAGLIAGLTVAAIVAVGCCITLGVLVYRRRRIRKVQHDQPGSGNTREVVDSYPTSPISSYAYRYSRLTGASGPTVLSYDPRNSYRSRTDDTTTPSTTHLRANSASGTVRTGRMSSKTQLASRIQDNSQLMRDIEARIRELEAQDGFSVSADGDSNGGLSLEVLESLRRELQSLRGDVERMRLERTHFGDADDGPPPSYSG